MGLINEAEEAVPDIDPTDESLPLYVESHHVNDAELRTPSPTAGPDEVRDYLVQAMQRRGVGLDHARRIAACWTIGTGQELRSYPMEMFRDLFGAPDGWAVYSAVKTQIYREENEKRPHMRLLMVCLSVVSGGVCAGGGAILASDTENAFLLILAFAMLVAGMAGSVGGCIAAIVIEMDPAKKAERELTVGWTKKSPAAGSV